MRTSGGLEPATMNIFGRITAVSGKRSGIFEDSVTANATSEELAQAHERKSVYQKAIALTPGTYKVDVVVRDVVTGNKGIRNLGFTVPRYDDKKLSTSRARTPRANSVRRMSVTSVRCSLSATQRSSRI